MLFSLLIDLRDHRRRCRPTPAALRDRSQHHVTSPLRTSLRCPFDSGGFLPCPLRSVVLKIDGIAVGLPRLVERLEWPISLLLAKTARMAATGQSLPLSVP